MQYDIYPKQFRNARIPIDKNQCFVLMPFNDSFDLIYGEIKQCLLANSYICNRADELFGSVPIMSNVLKGILQAHFVIADLTHQNANVFYELGVAHSFKDAHNIILIAQHIDDIPFDIRHLRTIIYSKDNIKYLTSNVLQAIKDNSHYYTFFESLQRNSIISSIHDDKYDYIETFQGVIGEKLGVVTDLLNGVIEPYGEEEIRDVLDSSLGIFYTVAAEGERNKLPGIVEIIGTLLSRCNNFAYSYELTKHLLYEIKLENYSISRAEIISLQSKLAIKLASNKVFFSDVISWIIDYFKRSKSATIDLNRYNLERYLLTTEDIDVDTAIVNSLLHDNYYVREHMADIIGEKGIVSGVDTLIVQLGREDNIYTTSSIITALGKLGSTKSYDSIKEWFKKNENNIIKTKHFFIIKHIHISIIKLNQRDSFLEELEKKYAEHIQPLAIY